MGCRAQGAACARKGADPPPRPDRPRAPRSAVGADRQELHFRHAEGRRTLAELFDGRRQLLVQHFMFAPGWEQGCKNCSYMADHSDGAIVHLAQRDVTLVAVSRAPLAEIERFRQRMGWKFAWVSSHGNDFNRDFHVSFTPDEMANGKADYNFGGTPAGEEMPGVSVFWKDDAGEVFHTYSTYGRGVEVMMHTYRMLDLTPKGRDENGRSTTWSGCATTTATSRRLPHRDKT